MRRLGSLLVALGLIVATAVPSAAGQEGPAGHGVGTDVRVDGTTVTVIVHLSVLVRRGLVDASVRQYLLDQLDAAADRWNRGLARRPFFDCLTLRVEVDASLVHPVDRDFDAPGHVITTYGSSHVGTMADGRGLPSVWDPEGQSDPSADYAGPFEHRVEGYWPPWLFDDTAALAHEMGHLFGLGDDYVRDEDGNVSPLEGREGTLMDSGDAVDPALVDRLGASLLEAGYGDQLPRCEVWTGTLDVRAEFGSPYECEVSWRGEVTLTVEPDGTTSGSGRVAADGSTCPAGASTGSIVVTGTKTASSFELTYARGPDHGCGPVFCLGGGTASIPLSGPTVAEGSTPNDLGAGTRFVSTWSLRCTGAGCPAS